MKKITYVAALLGSVYFSNAQVGIGTPTPNASSMLDVTASNKGVLIPRVALENTKTMMTGNSAQPESLLVYNTATTTGVDLVTPGFYYWVAATSNPVVPAHWERVINQSQLNEIIANQADIEKIKALLNYVYPSNNIGANPIDNDQLGGGLVFTPADGSNTAKIQYVYFDITTPAVGNPGDANYEPAQGVYKTVDVTSVISDLIDVNESLTSLQSSTNKKYQYYVSETYLGNTVNQAITQAIVDSWGATPPAGVFVIDFVNGVANNFLELSTTATNIINPGGGYYTVQEYIKYLSQNSQLTGDTKIVIDATTGKASLQQWDGDSWESVNNSAFSEIVIANESKTTILEYPADSGKFYYISESAIQQNIASVPSGTTVPAITTPFENNATTGTLRTGVVLVDVPGEVVNNFETILDGTTTIEKPGQTNQYFTVEEYIEYLIEQNSSTNLPGTMVFIPNADLTLTSFTYLLPTGAQSDPVTFSSIVKANETRTTIAQSKDDENYLTITSDPKAADKIVYEYSAENNVKNYLDITEDIKWSIENNQAIKDVIKNILNSEGNVYYNLTTIAASADNGVLNNEELLANTFYYIDSNNKKVKIVLPLDIEQFITALTTATEVQKQTIKNQLGDNFNTTTIVNTGDVWNDGKQIYKGIFDAFVINGSANVVKVNTDTDYSEITLAGAVGDVISITVLNANGNEITSAVTDVVTTATGVKFRIGTGTMYNVLFTGTGTTAVKVLVEFSSTVTP